MPRKFLEGFQFSDETVVEINSELSRFLRYKVKLPIVYIHYARYEL